MKNIEDLKYFYLLGFFKQDMLIRLAESNNISYEKAQKIMDMKKELADTKNISVDELENLSDEALEMLYKQYIATHLMVGISTLEAFREFNNNLSKSDSKINKAQIEMFKSVGYTDLIKSILDNSKNINNES